MAGHSTAPWRVYLVFVRRKRLASCAALPSSFALRLAAAHGLSHTHTGEHCATRGRWPPACCGCSARPVFSLVFRRATGSGASWSFHCLAVPPVSPTSSFRPGTRHTHRCFQLRRPKWLLPWARLASMLASTTSPAAAPASPSLLLTAISPASLPPERAEELVSSAFIMYVCVCVRVCVCVCVWGGGVRPGKKADRSLASPSFSLSLLSRSFLRLCLSSPPAVGATRRGRAIRRRRARAGAVWMRQRQTDAGMTQWHAKNERERG